MEKFTVDIDKVLDDFEFNEDRASEIPSTSCINQGAKTTSNANNVPFTLPPSYEETMCYDTQNDTSYYQKTTQQTDSKNLYLKNSNNTTYPSLSLQGRYPAQLQNPPAYESIQNSGYNNSINFNEIPSNTDGFVLRNDELYAEHVPKESFSTEMLKIRLFKDENMIDEKNSYSIANSGEQSNHKNNISKKNSVSNVFNSLQEYINTDVVDVMSLPESNKQKNILTYPLLPKIENHKMMAAINSSVETQSRQEDLLTSLTHSNITDHAVAEPVRSVEVAAAPKLPVDATESLRPLTVTESVKPLEVTLKEVATESVTPREVVTDSIRQLKDVTEIARPTENIAHLVRPEENGTEFVKPVADATDLVKPEADATELLKPEADVTELVRPVEDVTELVRPTEDVAELVRLEEDVTELVRTGEDVTELIRPGEDVTEFVRPEEDVTELVPPEEDVTELARPTENELLEPTEEKLREENLQCSKDVIEVEENKTVATEIEEKVIFVDQQIKTPIGFDSITVEVSDAEIDDYLKDLEENGEIMEEISGKVEETSEVSTKTFDTEPVVDEIQEVVTEHVEKVQPEDVIELVKEVRSEVVATEDISKKGDLEETENIENEKKLEIKSTDEVNSTENENIEKEEVPEKLDEIPKENISQSSNESEEILEVQKHPKLAKLSTVCRPNSLDIVSSIDDDVIVTNSVAPPGETPMCISNKEENSPSEVETSGKTDDFSPSTSEVSSVENQEDGVISDESSRPVNEYDNHSTLGKRPPYWIPDTDTNNCMHCGFKFTVIKRRHHCRACGMVLCSKCCNMKAKLEYLGNIVSRVCLQCYEILNKDVNSNNNQETSSDSANNSPVHFSNQGQPNPNNPMEYCSTVPPLKQIENQRPRSPPTVMVPVGVLKRQGSNKSRGEKTVMFSDGIRPGCDLTELDNNWESRPVRRQNKRVSTPPGQVTSKINRNLPSLDESTLSYIPSNDSCLPPTINFSKPENTYTECSNNESVVEMLRNESLVFAIQRNFNVYVKIVNLDCCVNKQVWCFTTKGLSSVGQDEIIILLEVMEKENKVPKDIFLHLNNIYIDASKGNTITEMGFSIENKINFLNSKNHAGFLYVRSSYQCLQNIILPDAPYLFGILIHRWETPWVKIFPLRLLLRLGAEYRYYPCPIISTRNRESVFVEIGHTIINLLADFRNYSYTLPSVRGLIIHMEEKNTSVLIPKNRYDQVMRAMNNSSDHILAFAGNFSSEADSHLVCIQDTNGSNDNGYSTHAINIQNKPRKVTGASFIILNGALKTSSGLTAKSSVIEDGLMIHILPDQMVKLRDALRNMKNFEISCGCVNAETDEYVNIIWTENEVNFNNGVKSPIDNQGMDGVPSIRVHNGVDHVGSSKLIRWTEVFILQSGDENPKTQDPVDISKLSESISRSTCDALVNYLDLLATNNFTKVGIRVTLHSENVSYEAGSNGIKFAPIYMNSLDNALIPVLHNITSKNIGSDPIILELIFHILNS